MGAEVAVEADVRWKEWVPIVFEDQAPLCIILDIYDVVVGFNGFIWCMIESTLWTCVKTNFSLILHVAQCCKPCSFGVEKYSLIHQKIQSLIHQSCGIYSIQLSNPWCYPSKNAIKIKL